MSHPSGVIVGVGAENGLGAALCRRFAREGHHILVAGRTLEKIERVVLSIRETGGSAEAVETDTTREEDVVRLFDRAMSPGEGREPADLAIFNAGNNQLIDFRKLTAEQFEKFWRVGCFGGFLGIWYISCEGLITALSRIIYFCNVYVFVQLVRNRRFYYIEGGREITGSV